MYKILFLVTLVLILNSEPATAGYLVIDTQDSTGTLLQNRDFGFMVYGNSDLFRQMGTTYSVVFQAYATRMIIARTEIAKTNTSGGPRFYGIVTNQHGTSCYIKDAAQSFTDWSVPYYPSTTETLLLTRDTTLTLQHYYLTPWYPNLVAFGLHFPVYSTDPQLKVYISYLRLQISLKDRKTGVTRHKFYVLFDGNAFSTNIPGAQIRYGLRTTYDRGIYNYNNIAPNGKYFVYYVPSLPGQLPSVLRLPVGTMEYFDVPTSDVYFSITHPTSSYTVPPGSDWSTGQENVIYTFINYLNNLNPQTWLYRIIIWFDRNS